MVCIIALGSYGYELFYARDKAVIYGIPKHQDFWTNFTTRVFRNDGFIVGYSEQKANPLWVMYKIQNRPSHPQKLKRPSKFSADMRSLRYISHEDYTRSGYDRGHMAPNFAMSVLHGKSAQKQSFLMTNITPQKANLNQKIWQTLEIKEYNEYASRYDTLWVVTGPIFDDDHTYLSSAHIEIPDSFYKIFLGIKGEKLDAFCYIIPQNVKGFESLENFKVSIDTIEKLTGWDFFWKLEDDVENRLELN
jgi:endonuclease G